LVVEEEETDAAATADELNEEDVVVDV